LKAKCLTLFLQESKVVILEGLVKEGLGEEEEERKKKKKGEPFP